MNDEALRPESPHEIEQVLAENDCVLPVGNRTKKPLSRVEGATVVSLSQISGITQYEPSEFTFTARAGTRVAEIKDALHQRGQYLPFDPPLVRQDATIGGSVAAGISGPGRFRYGGIRDFLLGVRLLCGDGQWASVGGKVVKNAAGFDIHKLLVGSLGRLGLMTELTFKVFPQPVETLTLQIQCDKHRQAVDRVAQAASSRWELDAIEYHAARRQIYLRLGGPGEVNEAIGKNIRQTWGEDVRIVDPKKAAAFWQSINDLTWDDRDSGHVEHVLKVPTTSTQFLSLHDDLGDVPGIRLYLSIAGAVTWISCDSAGSFSEIESSLVREGLRGLWIRGEADQPWCGKGFSDEMHKNIKCAMDPPRKFPELAMGATTR